MNKSCTYCGAMLDEGVKICSNCGKVVPSSGSNGRVMKKTAKQPVHSSSQFNDAKMNFKPQMTRSGEQISHKSYAQYKKTPKSSVDETQRRTRSKTQAYYDNVMPDMNLYKGNYEEIESSGKENVSRIKPILSVLIKLLIILFVIYFAFAAIRILTTSHGTCKFETDMKLNANNYSQAFSNYFSEGKWRFNLSKNQVYYEGTSYNGDKYSMTFKHNGEYVIVETMIKNKEKILEEDVRDTELLGMFMAEGAV